MSENKEKCALNALKIFGEKPGLTVQDLLAEENGHHFYKGWHVAWKWGADDEAQHIDILFEHRMAGMGAKRVFSNGSEEHIETPSTMRRVGETPEEDERLELEYLEYNRRTYAALREAGLLPPLGENLMSQEINEYLTSGGELGD